MEFLITVTMRVSFSRSLRESLLSNNVVTAIQVAEIARLMTFDGNRLDFAKFAFDYTYDRDVYNVVADALTFQKNKEDLQRYTQTKR